MCAVITLLRAAWHRPVPLGFLHWVSLFKSILLFRSGFPSVYFQLRGTQRHSKCYAISMLFFSQQVASLRTWQEELQEDLISSTERVGTDWTTSLSGEAMEEFSQVYQLHENVISLTPQSTSLGQPQEHLKTALIRVSWESTYRDATTAFIFPSLGAFQMNLS